MDGKKALGRYVKRSTAGRIFGWLLLIVGLLCLCGGCVSGEEDGNQEAQAFYPVDADIDSYCYVDAAGISPWLFEYDGDIYYALEDAQGNNYILRWSKWDDMEDMTQREEYWLRESDGMAVPPAYRFQGLVKPIGTTVEENLAEVLGLTLVSFRQYFGNRMLAADETPTSGSTVGFYVLGGLLAAIGFCLLMEDLGPALAFKRSVRRLEETGRLEQAAAELEMDIFTVGKNRARLGTHFLYGRHTGVVVSYEDIVWAYRYRSTYAGIISLRTDLVIRTLAWNGVTAIRFGRKDRHGELDQVLAYIASRNPETFLGYSQPNAAAYNEKRREARRNR